MGRKSLRVLIFILLAAFIALSGFVLATPQISYDRWFNEFVLRSRSEWMTGFMKGITFLGSQYFLMPAYLLLIWYYLSKSKRPSAMNVIVIATTGTISLFLLKYIFKRPRPMFPHLTEAAGFSYPSGHAFSSFLFFGLCVYLIYKSEIRYRIFVMILLSIVPWLIGYSRVYLGVHFASDILAGFILSLFWLSVSFAVILFIRRGDNQSIVL